MSKLSDLLRARKDDLSMEAAAILEWQSSVIEQYRKEAIAIARGWRVTEGSPFDKGWNLAAETIAQALERLPQ